MSEDQSEAEGSCGNMIDPAPVPTAKVVETKKPDLGHNATGFFAVMLSMGFLLLFENTAAFKMLEMLVMNKLSSLPHMAAKGLMIGGEGFIVGVASYAGLKLLGKASDIGTCLVGGAYHTGATILSGIGGSFKGICKNIGSNALMPLEIISPAYAIHRGAQTNNCSYEKALDIGHRAIVPSTIINIIALSCSVFVPFIATSFDGVSASAVALKTVPYWGFQALNALYIVGRCAKERREAKQKVS